MSTDNQDGRPHDFERDAPAGQQPPEDDGVVRIHLEPCPCGETPKMLMLELNQDRKRGHVFGDCCGEWQIEFNNNYNVDKEKMADKAKVAWNRATRPVSS